MTIPTQGRGSINNRCLLESMNIPIQRSYQANKSLMVNIVGDGSGGRKTQTSAGDHHGTLLTSQRDFVSSAFF